MMSKTEDRYGIVSLTSVVKVRIDDVSFDMDEDMDDCIPDGDDGDELL